jgi:proteasome beta subunit
MEGKQQEILKTGTTTVGLVCRDCVILASDSKSTLGYLVSSKTAEKIIQVDERIALTTAGGSGDTQALARILKAEINIYRMTRGAELTVPGVVTLLANILQSARYYPYMAMLIIGGVDKDGTHIISIDPVGGMEEEKYASTGSGSPIAYGVLEDNYQEGMLKEDGIKIAVRAVRAARERDIFSGGKDILVAVIDKNGVEFVNKEKIKELIK